MKKNLSLAALLVIMSCVVAASSAMAAMRQKRIVDDNDVVLKPGNIHQLARPEFDRGPADANLRFERMILVLPPRTESLEELQTLIDRMHDPLSPIFHQWLTPEEFGRRFGVADSDLTEITSWLQRSGFTVDEVAPGRGWINFSGTVRDVERTFRTEIHEYEVDGRLFHANAISPSVPRALADIVDGVVSLHDFPRQPMNHGITKLSNASAQNARSSMMFRVPGFNSSTGAHFLAPGDFATIYDVNALYSAGVNGTGQSIAIVGRTDIALADVQFFRSNFGLPVNNPVFVHNGTDPGDLGDGDETEADLDVEWSGAVAPNATIRFVISKSTTSTDGVDLSAQYIVTNNVAPVMSTSFGQCESQMGTAENSFYNNLWSQAASQGITAFVSSGDSGAAGCNAGSDTTGSGAAVSGLASTPFNVAVGGTQFADTTNPTAFWSATNNATTKASALSYIPEVAWNESGNVSGGSDLWSSAGGKSTIYAKPSWQTGTGVPADGVRDVPDVSLSAAGHDGYLIIQGHTSTVSGLAAVGGTSAASPSFAGLMALVNQKTGQHWGNANTKFYALAAAQRAGTAPAMFHDITSGNNSVPGVTGFTCGTGYDLVTGLGSVDANLLVNNFSGTTATPDFTVSASPASVSVVQGMAGVSTITTAVSGGFNSAIALTASGTPTGTTISFSPSSIAAPGSGSSTMTVSVGATTATGTYSITVTATGGTTTHTTVVTLTVTASGGGGAQQLIGNAGFENGSANPAPWTATPAVIDNSTGEPPHSGSWKAWLDGYGRTHTDSILQTVTIPATATTATLTFFLHIDTAETTTTTAFDTLNVQVRNSSGTVLSTLATYSNLNKGTGYTQKSFNMISFKGQTVQIFLVGTEDSSLQTSFVVDDFALNVQ